MPIVKPIEFDKLNSNQKSFALADFENPCVSVAAAGSGKTTTAVARIQKMLESGVKAEEILLLSFTNAATDSIVNRVANVLGENVVAGITSGTFHSVFNSILRKYHNRVGLPDDYVIENDEIHKDVIAKVMEDNNFPTGRGCPNPQSILFLISQMKIRGLSIEDAIDIFRPDYNDFLIDITYVVEAYYDYCNEHGLLDYNDLLLETYELLKNNPDICCLLSQKFKYIIVDEYQDTNILESNILSLLRSFEEKSLTAIGDPNQSIFSFINADVKNIVNFKTTYNNVSDLPLTVNYRSNQEILDTANAVVADSEVGTYNMIGTRSVNYQPILSRFDTVKDETEGVIETIKYFNTTHNIPLGDIAVLIRNGNNSNDLEAKLTVLHSNDIPFIKMGGKKFLEKAHVQDIIQMLKTVIGTKVEISWVRTLKLLKGIDRKNSSAIASKLFENSDDPNIEIFINEKFKTKIIQKSLNDFYDFLVDSRKLQTPKEAVEAAIKNYKNIEEERIANHKSVNMQEEWNTLQENIKELGSLSYIAESYKTLQEMLDALVLDDRLAKNEPSEDTLTISTIHSAKGLEWKVVIFIEAADQYIPGMRPAVSDHPVALQLKKNEIEEGRRLVYVALTRAKDFLFVFVPKRDFKYEPLILSRFLDTMEVRSTFNQIPGDMLKYRLNELDPSKIITEDIEVV